ncbi:hypothetical protein BV20DRAFT_432163 [Pilatotrama ljubarskyi]|nr:hypothetical protein BV20DRAFT_432163 [Pilatotrama ljubarskyi]
MDHQQRLQYLDKMAFRRRASIDNGCRSGASCVSLRVVLAASLRNAVWSGETRRITQLQGLKGLAYSVLADLPARRCAVARLGTSVLFLSVVLVDVRSPRRMRFAHKLSYRIDVSCITVAPEDSG